MLSVNRKCIPDGKIIADCCLGGAGSVVCYSGGAGTIICRLGGSGSVLPVAPVKPPGSTTHYFFNLRHGFGYRFSQYPAAAFCYQDIIFNANTSKISI